MKRNIKYLVTLITLVSMACIAGCKKEDDRSFITYSSFTTPVILAPADGGYLNVEGTTVELKWESVSADGDAQKWDIYFGDSSNPPLVIEDHTSQTYTVTVEKGVEYHWHVIGYDSNGVPARSPEWSFKVVDPQADLAVDMSWATDALTQIGMDLDPEEAVDMRLIIAKADDNSIVDDADGSGFESLSGLSALPDGEYLIAADIYSTVNAGDFNKPINIDITLDFYQEGIIDESITFSKVMDNTNACDQYRTNLVRLVKAGDVYTITKEVSYVTPAITAWNGDDAGYTSEVETYTSCEGLTMTGLGFGWMLDWWGEVIVSGGTLIYEIDGTTINIPLQKYCKTTYNGAPQTEYYIKGTGTIDNTGEYPVYTIRYDYIQGGSSIAEICMDYGWPTDYFEAVITTAPDSKKSAAMRVAKPVRTK